jgi:hypothetical protein
MKQLLSHTSSGVVTQAIATILHLMNATSLSNTNSTKILELDDELASSLRDVVGGRDELEMATFTEDEVLSLTAICARLSTLSGRRDMTAWADEDEGGKQSSAWDILAALAERGRLGYKEEEMVGTTTDNQTDWTDIRVVDGRTRPVLHDGTCHLEVAGPYQHRGTVTRRGSVPREARGAAVYSSQQGDRVRNWHSIEHPRERQASGKPPPYQTQQRF